MSTTLPHNSNFSDLVMTVSLLDPSIFRLHHFSAQSI